jgi:hypothetical protein
MMGWRCYDSGDKGCLRNMIGETFLKSLTWNHEQEMGGKMNDGGEDGRWNGSDGRIQ